MLEEGVGHPDFARFDVTVSWGWQDLRQSLAVLATAELLMISSCS